MYACESTLITVRNSDCHYVRPRSGAKLSFLKEFDLNLLDHDETSGILVAVGGNNLSDIKGCDGNEREESFEKFIGICQEFHLEAIAKGFRCRLANMAKVMRHFLAHQIQKIKEMLAHC